MMDLLRSFDLLVSGCQYCHPRCVMWGRTYARQRRARDVRRAAARAEAAGAGDQEEGAAKESG